MIDERQFATAYTSIWRELLPMSEGYVRRTNLIARKETAEFRQFSIPLLAAFSSELAFYLAEREWQWYRSTPQNARSKLLHPRLLEVVNESWNDLPRYVTVHWKPSKQPIEVVQGLLANDAVGLASRLLQWLESFSPDKTPLWRPFFPGCGMVENCHGDIEIGADLIEVKAVDRTFRAVDIRQLVIYSTLRFLDSHGPYQRLVLFNMRSGIEMVVDADELATDIAGIPAIELYQRIANYMQIIEQSAT